MVQWHQNGHQKSCCGILWGQRSCLRSPWGNRALVHLPMLNPVASMVFLDLRPLAQNQEDPCGFLLMGRGFRIQEQHLPQSLPSFQARSSPCSTLCQLCPLPAILLPGGNTTQCSLAHLPGAEAQHAYCPWQHVLWHSRDRGCWGSTRATSTALV